MIYFAGYVFKTARKTILFEEYLFNSAFKTKYVKNATTLRIISDYATPAMLQHHIEAFPEVKISILLGMTSKDGIQLFHHKKFMEIEQNNANIECYYNTQCPHIHSKIYLWEATDDAVMGSANYTINGLISSDKKEILCDCDIDSNATAEDLRARARVTRRPNINFFRLGIFAGEKIHFLSNRESDENIYAEIIDSNTVKYNGDIYSLTALTKKLLQYSGNLRPAPHWAYKDKKLSELYDECYRNE